MDRVEEKTTLTVGEFFYGSVSDDPYTFLKIAQNPDGSITRLFSYPVLPPQDQPPQQQQSSHVVVSKDVPLNPSNQTWIRIFRPHFPTPTHPPPLPIIIYFHGGGFILLSAASAPFHEMCERMATDVPAIVLSVEYRLAPEHRLPAAYDDTIEAVRWVRDQAAGSVRDPWMDPGVADFHRCFLMGTSAGGNIAYHAALRALEEDLLDPPPLFRIAGLILDQPFFGGVERTESELRLARNPILPLHASDLMWELALPDGASRDHEFCDPTKTHGAGSLPPCLVRGYDGDPLIDRLQSLEKMLKVCGVHVVSRFREDGCHGAEFFDPSKVEPFHSDIKDFISSQL